MNYLKGKLQLKTKEDMYLYKITDQNGYIKYLAAENLSELAKSEGSIDFGEKLECISEIEVIGHNNIVYED